jgi:hypothetical protein
VKHFLQLGCAAAKPAKESLATSLQFQAMLVHLLHGEEDQFLLQASCTDSVDDLIRRLVALWNLRSLLRDVCNAAETFNETHSDGNNPQLLEEIVKVRGFMSKDLVAKKTLLKMDVLQDSVRELQTAVDAAQFPAEALEDSELAKALAAAAAQVTNPRNIDAGGDNAAAQQGEGGETTTSSINESLFNPKTACMWWCKKPFNRKHRLQRRAGTNEKTKLVVQLTKTTDAPPSAVRAVVHAPPKAVPQAVSEKVEKESEESEESNDGAGVVTLSNFLTEQENARKRPNDGEDENNWKRQKMLEEAADEDEEWKLSGEQLATLRSSEELLPPLRDKRLQALVRKIDSAIDRPKALEEAVRLDPRFAEYYQKLLLQLRVAEVRSDGNLVMSS